MAQNIRACLQVHKPKSNSRNKHGRKELLPESSPLTSNVGTDMSVPIYIFVYAK